MRFSPFAITPTEIAGLDEAEIVRLMNLLLWDEGQKLRIPPDKLRLNLRVYDPDGGVDAITENGTAEGQYITSGTTVWQFKQGGRYPSETALRKELDKPKVSECFREGAGYILVWGRGMSPPNYVAREKRLQELAKEAQCFAQVRLFLADQVAGWASEVPAARFELRPEVAGYYRADQFLLNDPRHAIAFEADELRSSIMVSIGQRLFGEARVISHQRIQGRPGVGKTRLAMEAIKAAGHASLALYCPSPPGSGLFAWVAGNPEIDTTVVVDECDEAEALQLEALARQCSGRLRLLTVGEGSIRTTGPDVYILDPLDVSALQRVVTAEAPGLTSEQAYWIAEKTRGFVKLATAVARAVATGRESVSAITTDREVGSAIVRLLFAEEATESVLRWLSLLKRVGWDGEAAHEGQVLASFAGVDWNRMREAVAPAIREGLLVPKGRYVYVSPDLLAFWLANQVLLTRPGDITDLMQQLPTPASKDSLLERLAELGAESAISVEFERVLGISGPFRDIDSIDSEGSSRLFSVVAKGAPEAALASLRRILAGVPRDRLLAFKEGRRNIVWTLEGLAERRATFFDASRLLLALAEAENENISNNASGVWASLFLTFLAATEVPAVERFILAEEALDTTSEVRRRLAVDALAAALQGSEIGLPLGTRRADVPRPRWRPQNWGQVWEVKRTALAFLDRAMRDTSEGIRSHALDVFLGSTRALARIQLGQEVADRLKSVEGKDEEQWRRIWETAQDLLRYESDFLNEEQKSVLLNLTNRIYSDSLPDRIRRYVGPFSYVDWPEGGKPEESKPDRIATELGEEAVTRIEEVKPLLPWLVSGKAEHVWPFALRVGELDRQLSWFDPVFAAAKDGADPRLLSAYMAGRASVGAAEWRERLLDRWAQESELANIVLDATSRGPGTDRAVKRIAEMVDRRYLKTTQLGWVAHRGWAYSLSEHGLLEILQRLARDESYEASQAGIALLFSWLGAVKVDDQVARYAWVFIERPSSWGRETMLSHYWTNVATALLPSDPVRVARAVIRSQMEGETRFRDTRLKVLSEALRLSPMEVMEEIGKALLSAKPASYGFTLALEQAGFASAVPLTVAMAWAKKHGPKAARSIAKIVHLGEAELLPLARELVRGYGREVGDILAGKLHSGMWVGTEATLFEKHLDAARRWACDGDPAVQEWATRAVRSLEASLRQARLRDEEGHF